MVMAKQSCFLLSSSTCFIGRFCWVYQLNKISKPSPASTPGLGKAALKSYSYPQQQSQRDQVGRGVLIEIVVFQGKQELTFWGNDEGKHSENKGHSLGFLGVLHKKTKKNDSMSCCSYSGFVCLVNSGGIWFFPRRCCSWMLLTNSVCHLSFKCFCDDVRLRDALENARVFRGVDIH